MNKKMNSSYLMPTYPEPSIEFVSGSGMELVDSNGGIYLDFLAGLAVVSLGHSHPVIASALAKQAQKLQHTSNLFGNEHNNRLAKELDELLGGGGQIFFANSGAEANEAAIKLARKFGGHGRHKIICAYASFHGRTLAALAATGQPEKQEPFAPMPEGFSFVEYGNADAIDNRVDGHTCAILLEPIQGEGGIIPAPEGYLEKVRKICDEKGILLILDEVQSGMGRTGKWFAHQHYGIVPDVVTMAKALGNGFPVGACWAKKEIAGVFEPGDHASTFGGQMLASVSALASIAELKKLNAPKRAKEMGEYLSSQLGKLQNIAEVRGMGLMLAAELGKEYLEEGISAKAVADECLLGGLIVNAVTPSAIRFTPPLIVDKPDIDRAVQIFSKALDSVADKKQKSKKSIEKASS